MRKLFTLVIPMLTICFFGFSQNSNVGLSSSSQNAKAKNINFSEQTVIPASSSALNLNIHRSQRAYSGPGVSIGTTTYDLQTNDASIRRIWVDPTTGDYVGVWTGSTENNTTWSDRGTFYNSSTGGAWGSAPTAKLSIESTRHGWPAGGISPNGGFEFWTAHESDPMVANSLNSDMGTSSSVGSGSFTATTPSIYAGGWPRAAVGGANGTTIHMLNTHSIEGMYANHVDMKPKYFRSTDGGATWVNTFDTLAGIVDSNGFSEVYAESYAISSYKDVVVAAIGSGGYNPLYLSKSTDNGNTWTFQQVPMGGVHQLNHEGMTTTDFNMDGTVDIADTTHSHTNQDVLVDHNGIAHVVAASRNYIDDDDTDSSFSFFATLELMYWNDTMTGNAVRLGGTWDYDGSGVVEVNADFHYDDAMKTFPVLCVDSATNTVYIVYSCFVENTQLIQPTGETTNDLDQTWSDLYGTFTTDGTNFSSAVNLTKGTFYGFESINPSTTQFVSNGNVPVLWQRDGEPGIALQRDMDPVTVNDLMFHEFAVATDFVESPPVVDFTVTDDHLTQTAGFAVMTLEDASTGAEVWQWDIQDQAGFVYASFIEPFQGPLMSHLVPCDETYDITLTVNNTNTLLNGTPGSSITKSHTIPNCSVVGIEESKLLKDVMLYPNPTEGLVKVDVNNSNIDKVNVTVRNVLGETILNTKEFEISSGLIVLDLSNNSDGLYIVEIETEGNSINKRVTLAR